MTRTKFFTLLTLLALTALVSVACAGGATDTAAAIPKVDGPAVDLWSLPQNSAGYRSASAKQVASALTNKNFTLINVHVPYAGELPETDALIPFNEIEANLGKLPNDKDAPIVVYCRSGGMSAVASKTLAGLGYTNIVDLSGGMNAWQQAGGKLLSR